MRRLFQTELFMPQVFLQRVEKMETICVEAKRNHRQPLVRDAAQRLPDWIDLLFLTGQGKASKRETNRNKDLLKALCQDEQGEPIGRLFFFDHADNTTTVVFWPNNEDAAPEPKKAKRGYKLVSIFGSGHTARWAGRVVRSPRIWHLEMSDQLTDLD